MRTFRAIAATTALTAAATNAHAQDGHRHTAFYAIPHSGLVLRNVDAGLAAHTGVNTNAATLVAEITPTDDAGALQRFDIITGVEGYDAADPASIAKALRDASPGDTLRLTVVRAGKTIPAVYTVAGDHDRRTHRALPNILAFPALPPDFAADLRALHERVAAIQADALRHQAQALKEMKPFLDAVRLPADEFRDTITKELRDALDPEFTANLLNEIERLALDPELRDHLRRAVHTGVNAFLRSVGVNINDNQMRLHQSDDKLAGALAAALIAAAESTGAHIDQDAREAIHAAAARATANLAQWSHPMSDKAREALETMQRRLDDLRPGTLRRTPDNQHPEPTPAPASNQRDPVA